MMKYLTIGFIMVMYNFISAFTWDKIGSTAFDKITSENKFGIKQFAFYIATQIISTVVMSTALCGVMTDPEM
jgi:hypothetical protein